VRSKGAGDLHSPPPVKSYCVACGRAAVWSSSGFLESENRGETALFCMGKTFAPKGDFRKSLGGNRALKGDFKIHQGSMPFSQGFRR
jgi:hypothetical protein